MSEINLINPTGLQELLGGTLGKAQNDLHQKESVLQFVHEG